MANYIKYENIRSLFCFENVTASCDVDIHIHDSYEIFQAQSNNIRYFVDGHSYDLNKNDLIITSNKEIHRPMCTDSTAYGRRFIQFDPIIVHTYIDIDYNPLRIFEKRERGNHNHLALSPDNIPLINRYFENILKTSRTKTSRAIYESRIILIQLLMELDHMYDTSNINLVSPKAIDPRIYEIRQYLDKHYTDTFDLNEISKNYHMDKYYLSHLFKENTGFTLLEYVQSKRMMLAKSLLQSDKTIIEISQECGYEDYSNFYKTFKKLAKASPKQYRLQI